MCKNRFYKSNNTNHAFSAIISKICIYTIVPFHFQRLFFFKAQWKKKVINKNSKIYVFELVIMQLLAIRATYIFESYLEKYRGGKVGVRTPPNHDMVNI
jgi:hypothetical protein